MEIFLSIFLSIAVVALILELLLAAVVSLLRPRFQWLIKEQDVAPDIDPTIVEKHVGHGFDPELGWVRKPGTTGIEQTESGPCTFEIDEHGCRVNPGFSDPASAVVAFGDSFAFCRLSANDETWPYFLSNEIGEDVRNYGVGNYGLDQALLRLERELPNIQAGLVLMAVVPETMARIHSYWKHYYEYGNVLAFKPRFVEKEGVLELAPCAVQTAKDYQSYREKLGLIQQFDYFYARKFRRDILRSSYLLCFMRRAQRHIPILYHLVAGVLTRQWERGYRRAFAVVLRCNGKTATRLYADENAKSLFRAIAARFHDKCKRQGLQGALVILPQPTDLKAQSSDCVARDQFFAELGELLPVCDLIDVVGCEHDWNGLYVSDHLGPHFNAKGNRLVAEKILAFLRERRLGPQTVREGSGHA